MTSTRTYTNAYVTDARHQHEMSLPFRHFAVSPFRLSAAHQYTTSFGEPLSIKGAVDTDRARTGFIGRETDAEHNLGAFGARLYSSEYGRFMAVDKLWEKYRTLQPYQYGFLFPTMITDGNGLGPGDSFPTEADAARDWVNTYRGTLNNAEVEYASVIGKGNNPDGTAFFTYNEARRGNRFSSSPELLGASDATASMELTETAFIHNHPGRTEFSDVRINPMHLSRADIGAAERQSVNVYALLPNGDLIVYEHVANQTKTVVTGIDSDTQQDVNHGGMPDVDVPRRVPVEDQ